MDDSTVDVISGASLQTARSKWLRKTLSDSAYYGFLIAAGVVLFLILAVIKSKTLFANREDVWLIAYSMFVTAFELMRVVAATLYRNSINKVMQYADAEMTHRGITYEPLVTFVVPCKNEGPAIEETVRKCFEADYPADKLDVIVINDGSTDDTGKVLRQLRKGPFRDRLTVVSWRKNRGKRHGMYEGFRRAKGEIIIQLDSDSYIEPSTFRNIVTPFVHEEVAAVCAHADPLNADKNVLTRMQAAYYFMSFRVLKAAESVFMTVSCCSGCSSAYRKSAVMPVMDGWLHEMFLGQPVTWGDDRALTNWLLKTGHKTIYTDLAQAYTICPENARQFIKQQARWKKSWIINAVFLSKFIFKKHPFLAVTYFFPLILVSLLTPFAAARAIAYNPLMHHEWPFYYIFGALLLAAIMTVFYKFSARDNKYWPYMFLWAGLNTIFMSFMLFYAAITIQNRGWGTR